MSAAQKEGCRGSEERFGLERRVIAVQDGRRQGRHPWCLVRREGCLGVDEGERKPQGQGSECGGQAMRLAGVSMALSHCTTVDDRHTLYQYLIHPYTHT